MAHHSPGVRIGVDTGGTFTDIIMTVGKKQYIHKLLSTPENPALAVLRGIREILADSGFDADAGPLEVIHGSTVATNTLLERNGAVVALVTTAGFEDILEIGRQARPALYDLSVDRPAPLVPAERRMGIDERMRYTGEVETPIDLKQLEAIADRLAATKVDAVAVCFLFAYVNPEHEQIVARRLAQLKLPISCSHQILPEYREYERFSTTAANAYVQPKLGRYIATLESGVKGRLRLMQSNGGSISATTAREEPVRTALSGPAGGVLGAYEVARISGYDKIISFDMGGTSTDVSLCDGKIMMTTESVIGGAPIKTPMIDIHTVGAGGGSIAEIDIGGALRVGPRSAGAHPGPICYGQGVELTVTDANLFLNRIDPDAFLGGRMALRVDRMAAGIESFADQIGLTPIQTAEGILKVANATMERAIRVISVERGFDTREFALISFGGAGGLHACDLARSLAIPTVLVPPNGGLLSAYGMLLSDVVKDYSQTVLWKTHMSTEALTVDIRVALGKLIARATCEMQTEGFPPEDLRVEQRLDMRYEGQSYELNVPFDADFVENFHRAHHRRFGYAKRDARVEVVNLRLRAIGKIVVREIIPEHLGAPDPAKAFTGEKKVIFDGRPSDTGRFRREKLEAGNQISGPAIITEFSATTVVPPDFQATVDAYRNLILTRL